MGGYHRKSYANSMKQIKPLEEKKLVRSVREKGDREAFKKIFLAYYERLYGFAYSFVKRSDVAEDIVQTVFLKIWEQKESWDPPGLLKHYLFTAVRNEALNILKHLKIVSETEEEVSMIYDEIKSSYYSEQDQEVEKLRKEIQKAIDKLPERCQQIYILSRRSGLTYAEIAEILEISVNTVGTQMGRALSSLRSDLSDYLSVLVVMGLPAIFIHSKILMDSIITPGLL